jgi:thiol-disulfide isomerase/thioredoxin
MKRFSFVVVLRGAMLAAAVVWCVDGALSRRDALAQDAADEKADDAATDAADEKPSVQIPTGSADEIQAFMHKLAQAKAEGETEQEQTAYAKKVLHTMVTASDRLMKAKPSKAQLREAYEFKIMALQVLAQVEGPAAQKLLTKTIETARNDARPEVAAVGWQTYLQLETGKWDSLDDAAKNKIRSAVVAYVKEHDSPLSVSIVRTLASALDRVDDQYVASVLKDTLPVFEKSKNEKVTVALDKYSLQGMLRRLTLLGNPMEISGTTLDGKKVDWKSYRGKIVLVDFWASWCGPCRAEVPNVLQLYKEYHDKGFDVLGVSLDDSAEKAEQAIAEMELPWPSIFPKQEKDRGWNHPLANYYGITGIPTAILVGKDGKVVHMEARGDVLREQLKELLGDPVEPKEAAKDEDAKAK